MDVHAGVIAAGVAVQTAAIAPQLLTPVDPIPDGGSTTEDAVRSARLYPSSFAQPVDAAIVATMQLTAGIPPRDVT